MTLSRAASGPSEDAGDAIPTDPAAGTFLQSVTFRRHYTPLKAVLEWVKFQQAVERLSVLSRNPRVPSRPTAP